MSSLCAPHDRERPNVLRARVDRDGNEMLEVSPDQLIKNEFVEKIPARDIYFSDPVYNQQVYCLHSFVPTKGATPDEKGVFGYVKCRGTYGSVHEATERAKNIVRDHDSYHDILTGYVGKPFPLAVDIGKYVEETEEVDIRKHLANSVSEDVKKKKEEEKKQMASIKDREKQLLSENKEDTTLPDDELYFNLMNKRAQIIGTYKRTQEKLEEMKNIIRRSIRDIKELDDKDSTLRDSYMERFNNARRDCGLGEINDNDWIQYLDANYELDFDTSIDDEKVE